MSNDLKRAVPLTLTIGLFLAGCAAGPRSGTGSDFEATLSRHIEAIRNRDLAAIEATITSGDDLVLIFPNGRRTTTREAYLAFHRDWFASDTWKMSFERQGVSVGSDFAFAKVRTRYEDVENGEAVQSRSWLTLTFRRERDRWALVHDQNTRIE